MPTYIRLTDCKKWFSFGKMDRESLTIMGRVG